MTPLKPGLTGTAELIVGPEHTAESVGSGKVGVLATPVMINVIEAAALAAIDPHLSEGHQSLGTFLQVSHIAATPVGMPRERDCRAGEGRWPSSGVKGTRAGRGGGNRFGYAPPHRRPCGQI